MSNVWEHCDQCKQYVNLSLGHYVRGHNENGENVILHQSCLRYYLHGHRFNLTEEVIHDAGRVYTHCPRLE